MKKLIILVVVLLSCEQKPTRSDDYSYASPWNLNDGFTPASLDSVGIDSVGIIQLTKKILSDSFPNIHSLLILKDDRLVYENYFAGKDQIRGENLGYVSHSADDLHDCRSISKSVTSACIGIAIEKGFIKGVDEPVYPYFKEYATEFDSQKKKITIKDLLTMTSGLKWNEEVSYTDPRNSELRMDFSFRPYRFVITRDLIHEPGSIWNYNGGNTELLAEIIRKTSGLTVDKFVEKYLFSPIGVKDYVWLDLFKDHPAAASGLRLRSRDLVKIGSVYLNDGKWNNAPILDSSWVKSSMNSFISRESTKYTDAGYGYQFWTFTVPGNGETLNIVEAKGNGGQNIFICKQLNMVVVFTAGNYNQWDIKNDTYAALVNYIIPSVKNLR